MTCFRWKALAVLAAAVTAHAASLDCAKGRRPVEIAICSDAALSSADSRMAAAYRTDLSRLSSNSVGLLRVDQVQWLAFAQGVCRVNEAATTKAAVASCLRPLYNERIRQLRGAVGIRDGLAFLTRTQSLAEAETPLGNVPPSEHPGFGTMKISWPAADTDADDWVVWSAAVEARMLKTAGAGQIQEQAEGLKRTLPKTWDDSMAAGADTQLSAVLQEVEHGRVTTVISTFGMGQGAAHPFGGVETLTWLLQEKRALRASDVFADDHWQQALSALCWEDLQTPDKKTSLYDAVTGPASQPLLEVVSDVTNWTLEKDGLHISYPDYSVAPRMAQLEDTVIPWARLKPLLAKGFLLP